MNVIFSSPVLPDHSKFFQIRGNAGIDLQAPEGGTDAQNILRHIYKSPGCRTGKPAVFGFSMFRSVFSCDHLRVNIRFRTVDLTDILNIGGTGPAVDLECPVSPADPCLSNGYPGIVVTENAGVFFVSRGIGRNLSQIYIIFCVSRLLKDNPIFSVQPFLHRIQSFFSMSFFNTDISQDTEALRFDIYFPFFTFIRSYLFSEGVVCPDKPFSVPACVQYGLVHFFPLPRQHGALLLSVR